MKITIDITEDQYRSVSEAMRLASGNRPVAGLRQRLALMVVREQIRDAWHAPRPSNIAKYTRQMMDDLQKRQMTVVRIPVWNDAREQSRQRSRMYNAASRLGVTISTSSQRCNQPDCECAIISGRVVGEGTNNL